MNKCIILASLVLAQFPQPSATEIWSFVLSALFLAGVYLLVLNIQEKRRKAREAEGGDGEKRRILPDPLRTQAVKEYVEWSVYNQRHEQLRTELRCEFEEKFVKHDSYVREKFHDLSNDLNAIKIEAKSGRELATEQFQKIEGRIGEIKATTERDYAATVRTEQRVERLVENLPNIVVAAVRRRNN